MLRIHAAYDRLLVALGFLSGGVFTLLAFAISIDVLLRNLGLFSFASLLEITEYSLFATTFLAAPWALNRAAHVRVDLVLGLVPASVARAMEIAADLAGLAVCGVLGWHGGRVALDSFLRGDLIYKQIVVPEWILLVVIPFSCLLLVVEFLRRIAVTMRSSTPPGGDKKLPEGL